MDSNLRRYYEKAATWLRKLADKYAQREGHPYYEDACINLSGAYIALGDYDKALEAVAEAIRTNKTSIVAYQNKAICELKKNDYQKCIDSTQKYFDYGGTDKKFANHIIFCALRLNDNELAQKYLDNLLEVEGVLDLDVAELAIELYSNLLQIEKINSLLERISNEFKDDPQALRIRSKYLIETGLDGAEDLLVDAVKKSPTLIEKMLAEVDLANFYSGNKDYSKAAEIYSKYIDKNEGKYVTIKYAKVLYYDGKYGELLKWLESSSDLIKKNPEIMVLEAHANLSLCNLKKAATQFKQLYAKNNEISYLINYGICEIRQNNSEAARTAYDVAKSKAKDIEEWLPLSQGYATLGDWNTAIELAYKSYEKSPDDVEVVKAFMYSMIFAEQSSSKKVEEKYVAPFQKVMSEFSEKFPEDGSLKSIKIEGDDITPILEMVKNVSEVTGNAQQMYSDSTVPISFVSQLTGKNPIDVWFAFAFDSNVGIKAALGNAQERDNELVTLKSVIGRELVIDLHPLLLLGYLDRLDILELSDTKFIVHQSVVDLLNEAIQERTTSLKNGLQTMGYINGQFQMAETEPLFIQNSINLFKRINTFLKNSSNVEVRGFEHEVDQKEMGYIGKMHYATRDSAILAKQLNLPLYCDDKILKILIKNEEGVDSFSTHNFFLYLSEKSKISIEENYLLTKQILELNYDFINIDAKLIYFHLKRDGYALDALNVFSKHLGKKETTLNSLVSVLVDFLLFLLADIEVNNERKKIIFKTIIDTLGKNHDVSKIKEGLLIKMSQIVEPAKRIYVDDLLRTLLS